MGKKRIFSVFLAVCMSFCMTVCTQAGIASKVKVSFNGKTITFNSKSEPKTLKQVEKKWGKKTGVSDEWYVWEKGETKLEIAARASGDELGHVSVKINDQNASVAGVRIGMDKGEALKTLQKIYGEKSVLVLKKGQDWDFYGEDGYIVTGRPSSEEDECINVLRGHFFPIFFHLTDDKVSEIQWMRS